MLGIVVDIDDTLVDTKKRTQGIWRHILGCDVSVEELESMNARQIFEKHATAEQKPRIRELQTEFQDTLLCRNKKGVELMALDEPIPHSAQVVREWRDSYVIIYLTGRLESLRDETLEELERFGFPLIDSDLVMFKDEDWGKAALGEARTRLFSSVVENYDVLRVVDDFPGYFPTYRDFNVPERIGLLRSKHHTFKDFLDRGATKVVENWKQLEDDLPSC